MSKFLLIVLACLMIGAPLVEVQAQARKPAPRTVADPNCAFGIDPPDGTKCDTSDYTAGSALSSTDAIQICQKPGGCFGDSTTITRKQLPLLPNIRSSLSGLGAITYNSSTGAFSCAVAASGTLGCVQPPGSSSVFLAGNGAWAVPPGSSGGSTAMWVGTATNGGSGNAYTATVAAGQPAFANSASNMFCGSFSGTASTGAATLNVAAAGPLAINVQSGGTTLAAGAGDIPAGGTSLCFQIVGSTWVKQTQMPGQIVRDPGTTRTVTASEWAIGTTFVFSTAGQTLIFPQVAGLIPQGGITIAAIAPVTLQPNGADGINGNVAGTAIPTAPNITTIATTSGSSGVNALTIPLGENKTYPVSWGPGVNMKTVPIPVITRNIATQLVQVSCVPGGLVTGGGQANIDVWQANDGVAAGSVTTDGASIKLTTSGSPTGCNVATGALVSGTQQVNLNTIPGPIIPANKHLWLVATGTGWDTPANLTNISGKIQITLAP